MIVAHRARVATLAMSRAPSSPSRVALSRRPPPPARPRQRDAARAPAKRATARAMPKIELGYWPIRGLGAPARMLCEYAGADYADVNYADAGSWFAGKKPELASGNALINLPYVECDGQVVTHSSVVLEFLGQVTGVDAFASEDHRWANAQALAEIYDLRNALMGVVYPFNGKTTTKEAFEKNCDDHINATLGKFYAKFETLLKQRGMEFLIRDAPSSADIHLFEMLDQHEIIANRRGMKSPLETFPELKRYHANFKALPQLEKYFASAAYALPMNSIGGGAWIY